MRSFAFSGHLIEVSQILEKKTPEAAMAEIMSKVGFGSSDYGSSLADFEDEWMNAVTPQTTVIVLGDARSNNLDPRADILRRIAERSKRVVWLNPEGRMAWGFGDSEMPRYATFCSVVRQCAAQSSSSARCRTSWRRISKPPAHGRTRRHAALPAQLRVRPARVSRRAGEDRAPRRRWRQLPGADADRRRQVALLPAAGAAARRLRHRRVAADRADAATRSRRCRGRRQRRGAQLVAVDRRRPSKSSGGCSPATSTCSMSRRSGC